MIWAKEEKFDVNIKSSKFHISIKGVDKKAKEAKLEM